MGPSRQACQARACSMRTTQKVACEHSWSAVVTQIGEPQPNHDNVFVLSAICFLTIHRLISAKSPPYFFLFERLTLELIRIKVRDNNTVTVTAQRENPGPARRDHDGCEAASVSALVKVGEQLTLRHID